MPTLLQIDSCLGVGSTGRITESIGALATARGWECHIAHGARYVGSSRMHSIPVVTKWGEYRHALRSMLLDAHGLGSVCETKKLIKQIEQIKPDVIHLHCIHGYYLNYKVLFEYLNKTDIPVVWTFHDCWAFTGHCAYFDSIDCRKWQTGCSDCLLKKDYPASLISDRSTYNFNLKNSLFAKKENLVVVPVSYWLEELTRLSFFQNNEITTIHNGIDLNIFTPCNDPLIIDEAYLVDRTIILGVAAPWDKRKGLQDFIKLRSVLDDSYVIVLVGLSDEQIENLPNGVIGVKRTNSAKELAAIYSRADVFVNPTYSDNFPTTNIEALACGTPVITYKTGGSPEAVDEKTGIVVSRGDLEGLVEAIERMKFNPFSSEDCRKRAVELFNKDERFMDYIRLYEKLLNNK
jgi:glycosyltransferase involved in cell wall biosynthesis